MFNKVNKVKISEMHFKILNLFTKGFDKEYYIREVNRLVNISPRTAKLILEDLEAKAIIESKIRRKIKTFKLKKSSKEYLILTEQYKKIVFLESNHLINEIVQNINKKIEGIGIIFGSYAKGIQKKNSDLDIFIIGKYDKKIIKEQSKLFSIGIDVKNYSLDIFKEHILTDPLIKEVLNDHVIIKNAESLIEEIKWIN